MVQVSSSRGIVAGMLVALTLAGPELFPQTPFGFAYERRGGASRAGEFNAFSVVVRDSAGAERYRVGRDLPFDVPYPSATFSERTGTLILAYAFDGFVEVYGANGRKAATLTLFDGMPPNYERTITCALGDRDFVLATSDVTLPRAMVRAFTFDGRLRWKTDLPYRMGYEVALSGDESMIAAGSYELIDEKFRRQTTLLARDGGLLDSADFLFRKAAFAPTGNAVALLDRDAVLLLHPGKGSELWSNPRTGTLATDIAWSDSFLVVQSARHTYTAEGTPHYADPVLCRLTPSLVLVDSVAFPGMQYSTSSIRRIGSGIELRIDGRTVPVRFNR